jgi:hypothetical protein
VTNVGNTRQLHFIVSRLVTIPVPENSFVYDGIQFKVVRSFEEVAPRLPFICGCPDHPNRQIFLTEGVNRQHPPNSTIAKSKLNEGEC